MLSSLHIENFALIDTLDIELPRGLAIITGETGAGKSIILGALGLLMGSKHDSRQLRDASRRIVVEAVFRDVDTAMIRDILDEGQADSDEVGEIMDAVEADGAIVLRREVSPTGRSRAFINDTTATLRRVGAIASRLVDIHSQRSNSLIERHEFRLGVLDALAGNEAIRARYRGCFDRYASLRRTLRQRREALERDRQQQELIAFRLERLRELKPRGGEQQELERRIEILSAAEQIRESIGLVCRLLDGDDSAALPSIHQAATELSHVSAAALEPDGDTSDESLVVRLRSAEIELRDIVETLHDRLGDVEANPALLQKSEARLEAIYTEEKRFGVESDTELEAIKKELETTFAALADGDDTIRELEQQVKHAAQELKEAAAALTASRREAAVKFSEELLRLARPLGMPNLKFEASVEPAPRMTADGADTARFLCAFNRNQPLRPLEEIASGGEMSRVMLCVKAIVAGRMKMPTVIFDEIDTGVSGDIADRMGRMMRSMAVGQQVIAITHLPQVAVMGDVHFKVYKEDDADATFTHVALLGDAEREHEIARMLSGSVIDNAALLNARSLLGRDSRHPVTGSLF